VKNIFIIGKIQILIIAFKNVIHQVNDRVGSKPSRTTGEEKPSGSPLDVVVESRWPSTARISWRSPPRDTWNGEVRGYYVGYMASNEANSRSAYSIREVAVGNSIQTYEYFLSGLKKGTEYSVTVKAFNSAGNGPGSEVMKVRTISGDLPGAPTIYLKEVTKESILVNWRYQESGAQILGFTCHYRAQDDPTWRDSTVPVTEGDVEYLIQNLVPGTAHMIYVTTRSSNGEGDPSQIVTVRTKGGIGHKGTKSKGLGIPLYSDGEDEGFSPYQAAMVNVVSITVAVVIVVIVIVIACVCVRKAHVDAAKPTSDFIAATFPRNYDPNTSGIHVGTTHRYVDYDNSQPLMEGNSYPTPYATMPMKVVMGSQGPESMKSHPMQQQPVFHHYHYVEIELIFLSLLAASLRSTSSRTWCQTKGNRKPTRLRFSSIMLRSFSLAVNSCICWLYDSISRIC